MSGVDVLLAGLNHGAENVLAHVVVNLDVVAFEDVVAVEFHLLTGDTRTLCNHFLSLLSVDVESLHLVERLGLGCNGSVKDSLCHGDEVGTVGHEVGFALHSHHGSEAFHLLHQHATVGCLAVGTLGSDGQSALAEQFLSLVEVSLGLGQGLLHVGQASACHGAELLDVFHIWFVSHNSFSFLMVFSLFRIFVMTLLRFSVMTLLRHHVFRYTVISWRSGNYCS